MDLDEFMYREQTDSMYCVGGLIQPELTMALRAEAVQRQVATTIGIPIVIAMHATRTTNMDVKYSEKNRKRHWQGTVPKVAIK